MNFRGPLGIVAAAALWATDVLARTSALASLPPAIVILVEHAIAVAALGAALVVAFPARGLRPAAGFLPRSPRQWAQVAFLGAGCSALATLLFTASFAYAHPSVAILLQKFQPLIVLGLATVGLRERPSRALLGWGALALAAGTLLSFPGLARGEPPREAFSAATAVGPLLALGAATLWGAGTVIGRAASDEGLSPLGLTFWRFAFGLAGSAAAVVMTGTPMAAWAGVPAAFGPLAFMALGPGLLALRLYYLGLERTPATQATLLELVFPVGSVALAAIVLRAPLEPAQYAAGALLLLAVTRVARLRR